MLDEVAAQDLDHIVGWCLHGRCFVIHEPKDFVEIILPRYFREKKIASFHRQLHLYDFCRITTGRDRGAYYHELFLKGKAFLSLYMNRTKIKGTRIRPRNNPKAEPNFYNMPFVGSTQKTDMQENARDHKGSENTKTCSS